MSHRQPAGALHVAVLLGGVLAIGAAALMARWGLDAGLDPLRLAAWRLTVAWGILGGGALLSRGRSGSLVLPQGRDRLRLVAAGACLGLHFLTWFASLAHVNVARATLLVTTSPAFSAAAEWVVLGRRPGGRFWGGLLVALAGAALVTGAFDGLSRTAFDSDPWRGDCEALAGAALMAGYMLLVQGVQGRVGTQTTILWTYGVAALCLWCGCVLSGNATVLPAGWAQWGSIIAMALIPQMIGHTALNWCLGFFSAGAVGSATLLEPVFAGFLAWWLLGETLTLVQLAGALLLLLGVSVVLAGERHPSGR